VRIIDGPCLQVVLGLTRRRRHGGHRGVARAAVLPRDVPEGTAGGGGVRRGEQVIERPRAGSSTTRSFTVCLFRARPKAALDRFALLYGQSLVLRDESDELRRLIPWGEWTSPGASIHTTIKP
jgi:hypothetical protein